MNTNAFDTGEPVSVFFDALILAGGRGSRLGGIDKAALIIEKERMVDRVISVVRKAGAARIIVAGPEHAGSLANVVVREDPPFSGPLAALGIALDEVYAPWVMLLACDLLHPTEVSDQLLSALKNGAIQQSQGDGPQKIHGVVLSDENGRQQWLASCMNTAVLREALEKVLRSNGTLEGGSLSALFSHMELLSIPALPGSTEDIDTPEHLAAAQKLDGKALS
ncbi:MAG: NTP transferase domain-containing protein [Microbacteriaceae bacterium]